LVQIPEQMKSERVHRLCNSRVVRAVVFVEIQVYSGDLHGSTRLTAQTRLTSTRSTSHLMARKLFCKLQHILSETRDRKLVCFCCEFLADGAPGFCIFPQSEPLGMTEFGLAYKVLYPLSPARVRKEQLYLTRRSECPPSANFKTMKHSK
jgi:hypothetical protein